MRVAERHEGWTGLAHGGVTALVLDEAVGHLLSGIGVRAVTARLEIDLRAPLPSGVWADVTVRPEPWAGGTTWIDAAIEVPDRGVVATLRALAIAVSEDFTSADWD